MALCGCNGISENCPTCFGTGGRGRSKQGKPIGKIKHEIKTINCPFCKITLQEEKLGYHYQEQCLEIKRLFTRCPQCNVQVRNEDIPTHLKHFCGK